MNEPAGTPPPPSISSTDELLDVFEHISKSDTSWLKHFADHGLEPKSVQRAIESYFKSGDGRIQVAVQAFGFGLAFGAMRLDPVEYNEEDRPPCPCLFCTLRRAAEAEAKGGGGEESS